MFFTIFVFNLFRWQVADCCLAFNQFVANHQTYFVVVVISGESWLSQKFAKFYLQ